LRCEEYSRIIWVFNVAPGKRQSEVGGGEILKRAEGRKSAIAARNHGEDGTGRTGRLLTENLPDRRSTGGILGQPRDHRKSGRSPGRNNCCHEKTYANYSGGMNASAARTRARTFGAATSFPRTATDRACSRPDIGKSPSVPDTRRIRRRLKRARSRLDARRTCPFYGVAGARRTAWHQP